MLGKQFSNGRLQLPKLCIENLPDNEWINILGAVLREVVLPSVRDHGIDGWLSHDA